MSIGISVSIKDEIVGRMGARHWEEVNQKFKGMTFREIEILIGCLWPNEVIRDLVKAIYEQTD